MDADESPHGWVHGVSPKAIADGELVVGQNAYNPLFIQ